MTDEDVRARLLLIARALVWYDISLTSSSWVRCWLYVLICESCTLLSSNVPWAMSKDGSNLRGVVFCVVRSRGMVGGACRKLTCGVE